MNVNHRLAAGYITADALVANSNYIIRNFPRQNDMRVVRWYVNSNRSSALAYSVNRTSLGGVTRGSGLVTAVIVVDIMTWLMVDYITATFYDDDPLLASAPVTYGGYDQREQAFYIQAEMVQPVWAEMDKLAIGYKDVVFTLSGKQVYVTP